MSLNQIKDAPLSKEFYAVTEDGDIVFVYWSLDTYSMIHEDLYVDANSDGQRSFAADDLVGWCMNKETCIHYVATMF